MIYKLFRFLFNLNNRKKSFRTEQWRMCTLTRFALPWKLFRHSFSIQWRQEFGTDIDPPDDCSAREWHRAKTPEEIGWDTTSFFWPLSHPSYPHIARRWREQGRALQLESSSDRQSCFSQRRHWQRHSSSWLGLAELKSQPRRLSDGWRSIEFVWDQSKFHPEIIFRETMASKSALTRRPSERQWLLASR